MNKYLVLLKLNHPEDSYTYLNTYLKTGYSWARPMPGAWIITTNATAGMIRDGIRTKIYPTDKVMVLLLDKYWATSNINQEITDWMKTHL